MDDNQITRSLINWAEWVNRLPSDSPRHPRCNLGSIVKASEVHDESVDEVVIIDSRAAMALDAHINALDFIDRLSIVGFFLISRDGELGNSSFVAKELNKKLKANGMSEVSVELWVKYFKRAKFNLVRKQSQKIDIC
jgi:hypothetical protein